MMAWWHGRRWVVRFSAIARGSVIAVVVAGLASCSSEGPYDHVADRAEEVRQLAFVEDVPYRVLTPEEFRQEVSQDVDEQTDAELRDYADTYGRLGFFDVDLDLRPIFTQSRIDATGAFYSPAKGSITFVGDPEDGTVVHEYVHALQDQHFDLQKYDDGARTTDAYLARRAVVEGDAVLAEARFLIEEQGGTLDTIDYARYFDDWIRFSVQYLDESPYPLIFRAYTSFVYTYGLIYSATNLFGESPAIRRPAPQLHPWTRQDELFTARPPATTARILSAPGFPMSVGISDVPVALAAELEYIDSDSLGAWYAYLLFRPVAAEFDLRDLAGDRVLFARVAASGDVGVLWASAWQSEHSAIVAEQALRALHAAAGEPVVVERRSLRVVLARNFPASMTPALVDAAFTGTATTRRADRVPLHAREALRHLDDRVARHGRP